MENGFEKYLNSNRDKLETGAPSPQVWQKLQAQITEHHQKQARIVRIKRVSWAVAASVLLCVGIGFIVLKPAKSPARMASANPGASKQQNAGTNPQKKPGPVLPEKDTAKPAKTIDNNSFAATEQETRQSLFYYARLIEIRQNQIKRLQAIDPDLYKESQRSINDLNKVYRELQGQLSGSINQERVIEEMMENLQMQEKILNNQLQLLKGGQPVNQSNNGKNVKEI